MTEQRLTSNQLSKIIDTNDNSQFLTNKEYYKGENVTIIKKDFDGDPDNRIPLPYGRRTVNDIAGYAYKRGNVRYIYDSTNNENSIERMKEFMEINNEPITSGEIFQDALVNGEGAELQYVSDGVPYFVQIPREQVIFIYKDQIKEELDYSIRYYTTTRVDANGDVVEIKRADVYYVDIIEHYESRSIDKQTSVDPQKEHQNITTGSNVTYILTDVEEHFYGAVPLYPYRINSDKLGVFQPSLEIIDTLDNFGSDSIANSLDRFNDTIMLFSDQLDEDVAAKIKEYKIFDDLGRKDEGGFVDYLNSKMDITSSVEGFELFERVYYELTGVPNWSDDKFNNKSGIAILYSLIPFENQVSQYEMYFTSGLKYRVQLLNNIAGILYGMAPVKVEVKWDRNLPLDLTGLAESVGALKQIGIVSDETLLNLFPDSVVNDTEKEIEKIEEQQIKSFERFQQTRIDEPKLEESGE